MLKRSFPLCFLLLLISSPIWGSDLLELVGPVSVEQAKQVIINWAGRGNLEIRLEGPGSTSPATVCWFDQCYSFYVWDPNPDHKYSGYVYVDSFSGVVTEIEHVGAINLKQDEEVVSMISPMQAINIAKEAVLAYFPFIPIDSFAIETFPHTINNGAAWEEKASNVLIEFIRTTYAPSGEEIWMDVQHARVAVNAETGEWWDIRCAYEPIEISPIPALSTEEVIDSTISFFYGLGREYVEEEKVEDVWHLVREEGGGPQRVIKEMFLSCYPGFYGESNGRNLWIIVDGNTGEILHWEACWGSSSMEKKDSLTLVFKGKERKWKQKPIIKNGEIFISLDDVKAMGFKVGRRGKGYAISYRRGKTEITGRDLLWVKGKVFIRSGALEKIKGTKVKYLKEYDILNIWVMVDWAYKRGQKERDKLKDRFG